MTTIDRHYAITRLCDLCPIDTMVYTVLRSVARSGMSRTVTAHVVHEGRLLNITHYVAAAVNYKLKSGTITLRGGGTDMGYYLVHNLSYALHGMTNKPEGAIKPDESTPCATDSAIAYRAGYTLKQEWV